MSLIKSFSVDLGDMFYIKHGSDNFTIIDCNLPDEIREIIVNEIIAESKDKGITRFISTHPDEDHIYGLDYLDEKMEILNFYCVKNEATKEDESLDFKKYCELRDDQKKSFYIKKGISRKWMNKTDEIRGGAGINILWPDPDNIDFKNSLEKAKNGESPNNISAIIKYSLENGVTALWMGDLETDFMEKIKNEVDWPKVDLLFAPHHGRNSGKVPKDILDELDPKLIIIGEAPSKNLNYYEGYNKITQLSSGDIIFDCVTDKVHIHVKKEEYEVDFLDDENIDYIEEFKYIGTLNLA